MSKYLLCVSAGFSHTWPSSAGLIFALELNDTSLNPCQVFAVVPGSPASLADAVLPGDQVSSFLKSRWKMCPKLRLPANLLLHDRSNATTTAGDRRGWRRGGRKQFDKLIQGSIVVGSPCTLEIVRSRGIRNQSSEHPRAFTDPFVCLSIMDRQQQ